ncbi:hypothetical protein BJV74DRAFT_881788 [Russula compacta]|nr:hypothetical protein BJV74DRAFT_881788 [Russula compacta]
MSSSSLLDSSFNPKLQHPFTDHTKGAMPIPPPPSKYGQGVPSTHYTYPQKPQSLPSSQPPSPLSAPTPQYPPPQMIPSSSASSSSSLSSVSSSGGIFTIWGGPDGRRTPELEDILSKKKKPTWSRK